MSDESNWHNAMVANRDLLVNTLHQGDTDIRVGPMARYRPSYATTPMPIEWRVIECLQEGMDGVNWRGPASTLAIAVNASSHGVSIVREDGLLQWWPLDEEGLKGEPSTKRLTDSAAPVSHASFSKDGRRVAVVSDSVSVYDRSIKGVICQIGGSDLHPFPKGGAESFFKSQVGHRVMAELDPSGELLAVSVGRMLSIWNLRTMNLDCRIQLASNSHEWTGTMAFSPDSRLLAIHEANGFLSIVRAGNGKSRVRRRLSIEAVARICWGGNGRSIALFGSSIIMVDLLSLKEAGSALTVESSNDMKASYNFYSSGILVGQKRVLGVSGDGLRIFNSVGQKPGLTFPPGLIGGRLKELALLPNEKGLVLLTDSRIHLIKL